jgi:hypothetical protein
MLRRLIFGLVLGLIVGGVLAAGLVKIGVLTFMGGGGEALAYLMAAVTGGLTGAVAGKPIWASDAKIEGTLKAAFGALMGAGAMFALRQWGTGFTPNLDFGFVNAGGPAAVGELPAASLPLIAAVLGALFGLDNTDSKPADGPPARKRVAAGEPNAGARRRVAEPDEGEEADVAARRAKR